MVGEFLALACALTWAISVILFKRSEEITPQGLNLFKNLLALGLLALTLPIVGQTIDLTRSTEDWVRLCVSGVVGITIADTTYFTALRRLGPAVLAIVECAYAPFVVGMAILVLDERPGAGFAAGATLIVMGIAIVSSGSGRGETGLRDLKVKLQAVGLALFGFFCLAAGVIIAKPALGRSNLVEASLVRLVAGTAVQLVWIALVPGNRSALLALRPSAVWWTLVPASVLGSYVSMLFWLGGFKWASASVAAVLNQLTTVFVLILARIFLEEPITVRRAVGAGTAIVGALLVLL